MTFSLTTECLFCGKKRDWNTQILVFYEAKQHPWEDKPGKLHKSGWAVTVCRECRKTKTVEELIVAAKEVY